MEHRSVDEQELIDRFHLLWYETHGRETWRATKWLGTEVQQCPLRRRRRVNGHPALVGNKGRGPGPYEAVEDFLATTTAFELDRTCERHLLTLGPGGYLRRVS